MKKLWILALCAVMLVAVAATAGAAPITMRLAHYAAVDHPGGIARIQSFFILVFPPFLFHRFSSR